MNLVFCGTPDFAVPTLERLIAEKFAIDLVVTNLDEPSGRGYEVKAPPVKQAALRAGLEVYQPAKLKDPATVEFLSRYRPDVIVVVAYGHILPKWMIDLPRLGCINVHASLLPKYRGAAPIQWSLIRGETCNRRHHHANRRGVGYRRHSAEERNDNSRIRTTQKAWVRG